MVVDGENSLHAWRIVATICNEWKISEGWSFSLGVGQGADISSFDADYWLDHWCLILNKGTDFSVHCTQTGCAVQWLIEFK